MAQFPGFRRANTVATAWLTALSKQGDALNTAWDGILNGTFGTKELMQQAAQLYQSQFDILDALMPSTEPGLAVPSWLTLDATKNKTIQALSGTVETRDFGATNANPTTSQLAAFSGPASRFAMSITPIDSTHLLVTITTFWYQDASGKEQSLPLSTNADVLAAAKYTSAPYLGVIYDQRSGTNPPLAVVTLLI
jgi:hypothetical protein